MGIISSIISGVFSEHLAEDARAWSSVENFTAFQNNRIMAEEEYNRNIEQWQRENEYNLPANQMLRYQQAGLNPNLVFGNGASSSVSAHSPQYQAPKINPVGAIVPNGLQPFNLLEDLMSLATFNDKMRILNAQATQAENSAVASTFDTQMKGTLSNYYEAIAKEKLNGLISQNRQRNALSEWQEFKNSNKEMTAEMDKLRKDLIYEQFKSLQNENLVTSKLGFNPYKGGWQAWLAQLGGNALNGNGVIGTLLNLLK